MRDTRHDRVEWRLVSTIDASRVVSCEMPTPALCLQLYADWSITRWSSNTRHPGKKLQ